MRAATSLLPLLKTSAALASQVWRGHELARPDAAADCLPSGFEALDAELPGGGWPRGQLIELLLEHAGIGELSLLLPALAQLAEDGRPSVWVLPCEPAGGAPAASDAALPYAPALAAAGIDPSRSLFVRPATPRESAWSLEQSLRAPHLGALVGWLSGTAGSDADFRTLRRLHLLAQQQRTVVFLLRPATYARAPSPAALRLQLAHDGEQLRVQVLKRRGRPLLEPLALQVHPARWRRAAPAPVPAEPRPQPGANRSARRDTRPTLGIAEICLFAPSHGIL